jgi:hypothetical protein
MAAEEAAMIELSEVQRAAVQAHPDEPLRVLDPRTKEPYVLVRAAVYDRLAQEAQGAPSGNRHVAQVSAQLAKRFRQLVQRWRAETEHLSSAARMAKHPAYQEIIQMGEPAIPLLLAELPRDPDFWFAALRTLTGENPAPPESAGNLREMARAWIEWGRAKGYINMTPSKTWPARSTAPSSTSCKNQSNARSDRPSGVFTVPVPTAQTPPRG